AARRGPAWGGEGERQAVATARDGDSEMRARLEGAERRHQRRECVVAERRGGHCGRLPLRAVPLARGTSAQQPNRCRSCAARSLMLAEACGKSWLSWLKVRHASFFCPTLPRDMPSFRRLSAPLPLCGYLR